MTTRVKIIVSANEMLLIREYKASDRNACIAIFKSNMPLYFAPEEFPLLENWLDSKDKNEIAYKNNHAEHFYVVEKNSKIVACGGFYLTNEDDAKMTWGMVENSFHKKGIGKEFLLYRLEEIRQLYPDCIISLDTSQHTYSFFEKMGFSVTKISKDAYGEGLDRYDMLLNKKGAM
ncbi:MAG: GNAT family N-acetyltransferase [Bacteroidetes bacterium]|nr:GNAT family N-acetyltransferase [Bacteroidota bacterium]